MCWLLLVMLPMIARAVAHKPLSDLRVLGFNVNDVASKDVQRSRQLVELFAGSGTMSAVARSIGLTAVGYDIKNGLNEDILSPIGFGRALGYVLSIEENGMLWAAPECSWWIWATSSFHQRCARWSRSVGKEVHGEMTCRSSVHTL